MNRKHYLLPAEFAGFAAQNYRTAKEKALKAKRAFLADELAEALVRQERKGLGLIYTKKIVRSGFTLPTSYEGYWLLKPKRNTIIGKRVQLAMDSVCELLEKWQWAAENALGIYESVYEANQFHNTVAYVLPDNSLAVSQHRDAKVQLPEHYKISADEFENIIKDAG